LNKEGYSYFLTNYAFHKYESADITLTGFINTAL